MIAQRIGVTVVFSFLRENQEKFDIAMKAAEEEKEKVLADQKAALQREREFAVAHAHSREQVQSARKLAELRRRYSVAFSFLVAQSNRIGYNGLFKFPETESARNPVTETIPKMGTLMTGDLKSDRNM